MKILIITPYYFPLENPRAYRWKKLADFFMKEGHHVTVLTADDHLKSSSTIREKIIRTGYSTPDKKWTTSTDADRKIKGGQWLKRIMKTAMWPDESMYWIKPALSTSKKLLDKETFDWVISVSHPFTSHIIASKLLSKYSFRWMVDIGDPFYHHERAPRNNDLLWRRRNRLVEKSVLQNCNAISVTNHALKDIYLKDYDISTPLIVAPPIMTLKQNDDCDLSKSKDHIHIGYFGTFYDGIRPVEEIQKGWKNLRSNVPIHLHFFGAIKDNHKKAIRRLDLSVDQLSFHGNIPRSQLIATMKSMDYLMNVENLTTHQLPSKWADYLSSEIAILNIGKNRLHELLPVELQVNVFHLNSRKDQPLHLKDIKVHYGVDYSMFSVENVGGKYLDLMNSSPS